MSPKLFLLCIFSLAVILHSTASRSPRTKRQGFCWDCDTSPSSPSSPNARNTTPTTGSASSSTPSVRDMYGCTSRCQVTSQYSPVCGSNGLSYDNISKLNCARSCGADVSMVRQGTCSPL